MDQDKKMKYCNYCDNLIEYNGRTIGLKGVYKRLYEPWQFFEGKKNSLIWIVGINQAFHERKYEVDKEKMETKDSLEDVFSKWKSVGNKYYESFKLLVPTYMNGWGKNTELRVQKLLDVVLLVISQSPIWIVH